MTVDLNTKNKCWEKEKGGEKKMSYKHSSNMQLIKTHLNFKNGLKWFLYYNLF